MITNRTGGRHGTVGGTVGIHTTDEPPTPSGPGVHTDDDPVIQMTPPAYSNIDLIDGGGPKIADAVVRMIFWGSAWREDPQLHGVISNVGAVIASPYTSQLSQYGVRPPTLDPRGPLFLTADPPNPFTDLDVSKVIYGLIDNETLPEPDENYNVVPAVFMPNGWTYQPPPGGMDAFGAHIHFRWEDYDLGDIDNSDAHFLWVLYRGLDGITSSFCHELVEIVTDPEDNGWRVPSAPNGENEIGDICNLLAYKSDGITYQYYWSVSDGQCVVPVSMSAPPPLKPLNPSQSGNFIQSNYGQVGNYELLVPEGHRLVHYARLNDPGSDQFRWIYVREVFFGGENVGGSAGIGRVARTPIGVSFLQSNFRGDGIHGNLDAVVRLRSSASPNSDTLAFMGLDSATNKWGSPTGIFIGGELISGVTGNPVMIQGNRYVVGNYELLVPRGQSIVHYARFNDPGYDQFRWGWQSEVFFGGGSAGGGAGVGLVGRTPTGVSFLQSNFRDGDMNGKLDAVVRLSSSTSPSGDTLAFMGLDSATNTWSNPTDIVVGGQPISGVTGDPVMVQANWGGVGNYELLVPQGQRLVHYARLNDPGPDQFRWIHVREVFFGGASAGGSAGIGLVARTPIAVSLLQSNYRGDGIHGNLDAVVRLSSAASPSGDTLAFMGLDSATNTWGKPTEILVGGQPISGVTGF